ncbi:MAG: hypothetical protein IIC81_05045 [Chloroflexi bacterium]|nr:hypothetical protein [Chloroflexota bacterium]
MADSRIGLRVSSIAWCDPALESRVNGHGTQRRRVRGIISAGDGGIKAVLERDGGFRLTH